MQRESRSGLSEISCHIEFQLNYAEQSSSAATQNPRLQLTHQNRPTALSFQENHCKRILLALKKTDEFNLKTKLVK